MPNLSTIGPKIKVTSVLIILALHVFAQKDVVKGWHLLDAKADGYHGISLNKAMELLKNRKPNPVIVAVMDGGIDTNHYALKNILWKNNKETASNKQDDDHNGYVDDVNGWNFLGNAQGENVNQESQEAIRVYHEFKPRFYDRKFDIAKADTADIHAFQLWQRSNQLLETKPEDRMGLMMIQAMFATNIVYDSLLRIEIKMPEYTAEELESFVPTSPTAKKAKLGFLKFIDMLQLDPDKTNRQLFSDLRTYIDQQKDLQTAKQKPVTNFRNIIVGDDENEIETTHYGNSDVMGGTPMHGTHVSGIIAGLPDSANDVRGVCATARIMMVRCIPDGDEHDKDIALGIRYAVDNGAKVINMSFGKDLSPHKPWVDNAIRYAADHDVLLVHASGNESRNIDEEPDYPSPFLLNNQHAANVITVGASGDSSFKCGMVADFTNYGKETVDVLAPGVKIYSSIPDNKYAFEQGTSMSAPIVSGIAALLRSYFPQLTAVQVKYIIESSADVSLNDQAFSKPGGAKKEKCPMNQLCKTGGIANAYNAVKAAMIMTGTPIPE